MDENRILYEPLRSARGGEYPDLSDSTTNIFFVRVFPKKLKICF